METSQDAAVTAVQQAEVAANVVAALAVYDALDAQSAELTTFDRYDFAIGAWRRYVDSAEIDRVSDLDVVTLTIRAAAHLPEHTVIDLLEERFGDVAQELRRDDNGWALVWMPFDRAVILTAPAADGRHEFTAVLTA